MLGIRYNSSFFDLYPNTSINLELNNPIFDDSILAGNYSFPFKLPLTPLNRQLLNFPDEPGSIVKFDVALLVDLYVEGLVLFPQTELRIKTVFGTYAECFVLVGVSDFADYANSATLPDMMDLIIEVDNAVNPSNAARHIGKIAENSITKNVDQLPYVFFTVLNNGNYPEGEVLWTNDEEDWRAKQNIFYNLYQHNSKSNSNFFTASSTKDFSKYLPFSMCPFFYVTYVLRKIFAAYNIDKNIFETNAELKTLCLLNNFCLDDYIFQVYDYISNPPYDPIPLYQKVNTNGRNIEAKNHVPALTVGQFLIALKNFFCLYLYKNPFTTQISFDSLNSILDAPPADDWTALVSSAAEISQDVTYGISYKPQANNDALIQTNPSTEKEVIKGMNNFSLPLGTSPGINVGDLWYLTNNAEYHKWNGTVWEYWGHGYGDYFLQPKKFEQSPAVSGEISRDAYMEIDLNGRTFNLPEIRVPGSYYKWGKYSNNPDDELQEIVSNPNVVKLAFYRGLTTPDAVKYKWAYPLGSSSNYFNNNKIANYSLSFLGQDGLFEVWWKKYLNFRANTKVVKARVKLDFLTLINLDMRKKISINGNHYFIKKISLQLPLIKAAEIELWKLGGGSFEVVAIPPMQVGGYQNKKPPKMEGF